MLPFENRLKETKRIERVVKRGKKLYGADLGLYLLASKEENDKKFAIVAGLKVSKRATERNKIKRRIREILRGQISHISRGVWGVVVIRKGALVRSFKELNDELRGLLQKGGVL